MMVTRIPPMIAVEPDAFDEHLTISEDSNDDISLEPTISLRPILYFSYEGEVAVQGIIKTGSAGDFCLFVCLFVIYCFVFRLTVPQVE